MNIEIYQTFHRPWPYRTACDWITPVAVGNYNEPAFLKDNTGDNIAHLNPYYAEFTTMYWAWKNRPLPDIVGFYHYRRYLHVDQHDENFRWAGKIDKGSRYEISCIDQRHMIDQMSSEAAKNKILSMMESTDILMSFPMRFDVPVPQQWIQHHPVEPLQVFVEELIAVMPHNEKKIKFFLSQYGQINWPVMIMRKNTFLRFCNQLFPLLDRVFRRIGTPYDAYQNRYLCFLVERFLPLWLHLEEIYPSYVPCVTLHEVATPTVMRKTMVEETHRAGPIPR